MKTGVSSYCFEGLRRGGSYTLFDAIAYTKKTGFDAIEFTEFPKSGDLSPGDFARKIRDACDAAGLSIANYTIGADFLYGSGGDIKRETARVKEAVDTAAILGVPGMRHDSGWGFKAAGQDTALGRNYRDAIRLMAPAIREVSEYAAGLGIRTMCENHGYFMQDSSRVEELVLAVNHPNFGLLVDIGNFMCADEPSLHALPTVMPYAFHVHAKDFLWKPGREPKPDNTWFPTRAGNHLRGTILGHGEVSVAQCLDYIKKAGYDGTISLEFEGPEEPLEAIRLGYEFIKTHISAKP
ncbi:MAG: sugar phosphate isomerase/epimerase [Treponema sp.]|jgi:sugar phosphate isomerase/epimerase|nr:sugar phosphate isomerase/epimerase [Treponema sp.]